MRQSSTLSPMSLVLQQMLHLLCQGMHDMNSNALCSVQIAIPHTGTSDICFEFLITDCRASMSFPTYCIIKPKEPTVPAGF